MVVLALVQWGFLRVKMVLVSSFTFGFGPSWGWSATEIKGVDVNGTSTSEVYRYDFK